VIVTCTRSPTRARGHPLGDHQVRHHGRALGDVEVDVRAWGRRGSALGRGRGRRRGRRGRSRALIRDRAHDAIGLSPQSHRDGFVIGSHAGCDHVIGGSVHAAGADREIAEHRVLVGGLLPDRVRAERKLEPLRPPAVADVLLLRNAVDDQVEAPGVVWRIQALDDPQFRHLSPVIDHAGDVSIGRDRSRGNWRPRALQLRHLIAVPVEDGALRKHRRTDPTPPRALAHGQRDGRDPVEVPREERPPLPVLARAPARRWLAAKVRRLLPGMASSFLRIQGRGEPPSIRRGVVRRERRSVPYALVDRQRAPAQLGDDPAQRFWQPAELAD
jgi:hypothetical protein